MAFQYAKLKGRIIEKFGTQGRFAEEIGLSVVALSKKMNGKSSFSHDDIKKWCEVLEINIAEIGEYFFA